MAKLSLSLALLLSCPGACVQAAPVAHWQHQAVIASPLVEVGCDGGIDAPANGTRQVRRQGNCGQNSDNSSSGNDRKTYKRRIVDCHRDVQRHRIGGVMIRHRHVGDDCAIREVTISN